MSNSDSSKETGEAQQEERSRKRKDTDSAATSVIMELEVLNCPVCFGPLHPPIFQCAVGHLICSSCRGKLQNPKKCHHCSCESDSNRCHGVEKIIESIKVPCSNTKYGCSVKTSYYERAGHETKCRYAPCFCPETGCNFSASAGLLQEHFTTKHHWPSTKCRYGWCFYVDVKEGVHVISSEDEQLFLLNIASEPFGCVISVFCVQPAHDTEQKFRCAVSFSFWKNNSYHTQSSEFLVPSTALYDGLPRDCFLFILPRFYIGEDSRVCHYEKDSTFQPEETDTSGAQSYSTSFSFKEVMSLLPTNPNATVVFCSKCPYHLPLYYVCRISLDKGPKHPIFYMCLCAHYDHGVTIALLRHRRSLEQPQCIAIETVPRTDISIGAWLAKITPMYSTC